MALYKINASNSNKQNIKIHIMNFSAILDISSFFIGMIINLLLIALICYYFKKKYEHLEIAQNEQAKVLYKLLQNSSQPKVINVQDILEVSDSESESESDSDSDSESNIKRVEVEDELKTCEIEKAHTERVQVEKVHTERVQVEKVHAEKAHAEKVQKTQTEKALTEKAEKFDLEEIDEKDYSKMNMKQLKDILTSKGINPGKMKKNEIIELIESSIIESDKDDKDAFDKIDFSIELSSTTIDAE